MNISIIKILATSILMYTVINCVSSCANIIPPGGGPRDSLPPVLVKATPDVMSKHIIPKKITLTFNEYVQLQDIGQNLICYPNPKITPIVESKLKNVTIKIRDTLQPNTTYVFELGNAIRDINENNAINTFTYVFSTGDHIDSLTLSGKIILAETGKTDSTMIAVLHRKRYDSAVSKERPDYYTKINGNGYFNFRFLPKDTFDIYALKDENGTKKYISPKQLFAFADKPVIAGEADSIMLYAYAAEKDAPKASTTTTPKATVKDSLKYTTNLEGGQQDLLSTLNINLNKKIAHFDSTKIFLADTSVQHIAHTVLQLDSTQQILSIHYNWQADTKYKLIINKDAVKDSTANTLTKNDTLSFTTKKTENYGSVKLRFTNAVTDSSLVLLLIQNDKIVETFAINNIVWYRKLFNPGEYEIRILHDKNKNGKWDPGDFKQHIQPEIIESLSQKLTVRSNWDNELDIKL